MAGQSFDVKNSGPESLRTRPGAATQAGLAGRGLAPDRKETIMQARSDSNGHPLEVLVVADDAMVRGWVCLCLHETEFRLAEARSASEALEHVKRRKVDMLLVDNRLPDHKGTELVRELRHSGSSAPALMMTASTERGFNENVRESGGQGTVLKTGSAEELLTVLRTVAQGERTFDKRYPKRPPGRAALSPREREILGLVASGQTNREISRSLGVGNETVKTLLSRTFVKLGARRRAQAVAAALERGLI
jgi:DNA-binding NarL/FixJ family response regulator